jgi:hypothetical protein
MSCQIVQRCRGKLFVMALSRFSLLLCRFGFLKSVLRGLVLSTAPHIQRSVGMTG